MDYNDDTLIDCDIICNWLKSYPEKVSGVYYEKNRKRFTLLLKDIDNKRIKVCVSIKDIIGKMTLGVFKQECIGKIMDFFRQDRNKSITAYLKHFGNNVYLVV